MKNLAEERKKHVRKIKDEKNVKLISCEIKIRCMKLFCETKQLAVVATEQPQTKTMDKVKCNVKRMTSLRRRVRKVVV